MSKRLVAVWVSNYMGIENQGFNLGGKHTFDFTLIDNTLTIEAKETINYVDLFQNSSAITNVTGIVGVNGTGKSSILKLLNNLMAKSWLRRPSIMMFEESDKYICLVFSGNRGTGVFNQKIPAPNIVLKVPNCTRLNDTQAKEYLDNFNLIFYSPVLSDQNDVFLDYPDRVSRLLNCSMSYRYLKALSIDRLDDYIRENKPSLQNLYARKDSFNPLKLHEKDKFERLVKFLNWKRLVDETDKIVFSKHLSEVTFPDSITIELNTSILDKLLDENSESWNNHVKKIYDIPQKQDKELLTYWLVLFYEMRERQIQNINLEQYLRQLNGNLAPNLKSIKLSSQCEWLKQISDLEVSLLDEFTFTLKIEDKVWSFMSDLIDNLNLFITEIKWSIIPRSTGEGALITQFAELFSVIDKIHKNDNNEMANYIAAEDFIISIDEGEAYFHPEWQRKYISSLCSFLEVVNEVQELNKKFQIILTSHSPFIVSDIPHYNLIKLQKDKNGFTKVMKTQETETLGGNIFKLFQDEFFVDEFISAFAYEKIKEAVEYIKSSGEKRATFKNDEDVSKFITLIGESVIRNQLRNMFERYTRSKPN